MTRSKTAGSASLLALALLFGAGLVGAQPATVPSTLPGDFRYPHGAEHARSIVVRSMEPGLSNFPEFLRGQIRSSIRERVYPVTRIEVRVDGDQVEVVNHGRRRVVVRSRLGGSTTVRGQDGEPKRVTQRLRGGWLEQTFESDGTRLVRLLSTEPDGATLHVDTTLHNDRLSGPVRWRLDYRRAATR